MTTANATKCAIVFCPWNAAVGGMCVPHHVWAAITLADDRYRNEKPPACPFAPEVIPTYASRIEHWLGQGDQASVAHAIAFWEFSKGEVEAMTEADRVELEKVTGHRDHPSERLEVSHGMP